MFSCYTVRLWSHRPPIKRRPILNMVAISLIAEAPPIRRAHGVLRVGQTGVTLETVLWAFEQGSTPEDIADQFPSLFLADVYDVIAYYLRHRDEVDEYLTARKKCYHEAANALLHDIPNTKLPTRPRRRRR